jgi:maleate isomerase
MTRHIGALLPATNTIIETEYSRLPQDVLQFHYARCDKRGASPFHPSKDEDVAYQSKMLGYSKVEVIGLIQTSASLFEEGYDARVKKMIFENSGIPGVTSAEAIGEAVRAFGAKAVGIVTPYSTEVIERASSYYKQHYGLEAFGKEGFGATDAYSIGNIGAENATEALVRLDRPEIEVFIIPGGNFQTMKYLDGWEKQIGKPIVATNQALVWWVMKTLGMTDRLSGMGRLLAEMP